MSSEISRSVSDSTSASSAIKSVSSVQSGNFDSVGSTSIDWRSGASDTFSEGFEDDNGALKGFFNADSELKDFVTINTTAWPMPRVQHVWTLPKGGPISTLGFLKLRLVFWSLERFIGALDCPRTKRLSAIGLLSMLWPGPRLASSPSSWQLAWRFEANWERANSWDESFPCRNLVRSEYLHT